MQEQKNIMLVTRLRKGRQVVFILPDGQKIVIALADREKKPDVSLVISAPKNVFAEYELLNSLTKMEERWEKKKGVDLKWMKYYGKEN